jgi:AcrR family transcriptional regulator
VKSDEPVKAGVPRTRRSYRSPARERRAEETRARIIAVAESLFVTEGYLATTIRAVADTAGVAEQTVYLVFKNKAGLLDAVIDAAIGGPSGDALRSQLDAALTFPPEQLLRAVAAASAGVMERTARILAVAEAAATVDPDLDELRERGHAAMRARFARIATTLHDSRPLPATDDARATAAILYALTSEAVYLRLTDGYGWTTTQYSNWLADLFITTLIQPV